MADQIAEFLDSIRTPPAEGGQAQEQPPEQPQAPARAEAPPPVEGPYARQIDSIVNPSRQFKELDAARRRVAERPEPGAAIRLAEGLGSHSIPWASGLLGATEERNYNEAVRAFQGGRANSADALIIAERERRDAERKKESVGMGVLRGVAGLPAIVGEVATGGALLRGAGVFGQAASRAGRVGQMAAAAPLVPSVYAERAAQTAGKEGGEPWKLTNLAPALAYGATELAVLGTLQGVGNTVPTLVGSLAAKGVIGTAELSGAHAALTGVDKLSKEVTGYALNLDTGYGTVGKLARGEEGGLKEAATTAIVFGLFAGLHGRKPAEVVDKFKAAADDLHRQGFTPDEAARWLKLPDLGSEAEPGGENWKAFVESLPKGPAREYAKTVGEVVEAAKPAPPADPYAVLDEAAVKALAKRASLSSAGDRNEVLKRVLANPTARVFAANEVRRLTPTPKAPVEAPPEKTPGEAAPTTETVDALVRSAGLAESAYPEIPPGLRKKGFEGQEAAIDQGDRFITLHFDPKENSVELGFKTKAGAAGEQSAFAREVRPGSAQLGRSVMALAKAAKEKGVGVRYTTEDAAAAAEQGVRSRHEVYGRGLERLGFRLVEEKAGPEDGQRTYLWRAGEQEGAGGPGGARSPDAARPETPSRPPEPTAAPRLSPLERLRAAQAARAPAAPRPQPLSRPEPAAPEVRGPSEALASNMRAMGLNPAEQLVLTEFFLAGRKLEDIGKDPRIGGRLGRPLDRQRVHQIKKAALDKLGLNAKDEAEVLAQMKAAGEEKLAAEPEGVEAPGAARKAPVEVRLEREHNAAVDRTIEKVQHAIDHGVDPAAAWAEAVAAEPALGRHQGLGARSPQGPAEARGGEAAPGDRGAPPAAPAPQVADRPATPADVPRGALNDILRRLGENPSKVATHAQALAIVGSRPKGRELLARAVAAVGPVRGERPQGDMTPGQESGIRLSAREWAAAHEGGTAGEQTRARNALKKLGAVQVGKAGERVKFDPDLHDADPFSGSRATGEVVRPGWKFPDGTVLLKPVVRRFAEQYELEDKRRQGAEHEASLRKEIDRATEDAVRSGVSRAQAHQDLQTGLEAGPAERPAEGRGPHEEGAGEPDDSAAIAAERGPGGDAGFDFGPESGGPGDRPGDFGRPLSPAEREQGTLGGGQPTTPGQAAPAAKPPSDTALANARVDAERQARGLPPLLAAARRANPEVWDAAMARLSADPELAARLVEELRANPRATTVDENALLLQRKVALRNEHERAVREALAEWPRSRQSGDPARLNELVRREEDLAARVNQLDDVTRSTGTEWGRAGQFRRQLAAEDYSLSGMIGRARLAKGGEPLTPEEKDTVTRQADEIRAADEELQKVESGGAPAGKPGEPGDVTDLRVRTKKARAAFAETLVTLRLQNQSAARRVFEAGKDSANAARSLVTAYDLSSILRQGGFTTFGHPIKSLRAVPDTLRALFSEHAFDRQQQEIADRPNAPLYDSSGLYLAETQGPLGRAEEAFASRLARRIPGVKASERAYTAFLNRVRADVFDSMTASLSRGGKPTPAESKAVANLVNVATGRGPLGGLERIASALSTVFFSPRYVASRFQLLLGQPLYGGSARTRKLVAMEYGRAAAGLAVFYGVMAAANDDVRFQWDPRSSDFGKLRIGNTRIDPLTGLAQIVTFGTRVLSGETRSAQTGKTSDLRGRGAPYGGQDEGAVLTNFVRNKLAPVPGVVGDVLFGKKTTGEPIAAPAQVPGAGKLPWGARSAAAREAGQLVLPISFRDVYDAMKEQGVPRGVATSVLAVLGMGTQVHERPVRR